jgi:hypothetical protein
MEHLEQPTVDVELWIPEDVINYRLVQSPFDKDIEDTADKISSVLFL